MEFVVIVTVFAAYASLLVELAVLRVPSVASSLRIWSADREVVATYSSGYRRLFGYGRLRKLLLFVAPLIVVYGVYLFPWLAIATGADPLGDYFFAPGPGAAAAAVALIGAGRVIAVAAALAIRRDNRQTGDSFRLHTGGLFRWSRNPGLVGMYLFAAGLWIAMPSATLLAGVAFYVVYMDFKVRMEEDFLRNKFGAEYAGYQRRTGRYIA